MKKHCWLRFLIILLAASFLSAAAACEVTEKQIIGTWTQVTEQGFFEEMAFELDVKTRSFSSWIYQRPEITDGSWALNNCRLSIDNPADKNLSFTFSVTVNRKGQLELKEDKDAVVSKYKRIP